jgi:trk system potassium uptake protein TrkA
MKIVIAGCGKVGTAIIARLVEEGHDVVAVDSSPSAIEEIINVYDIMCVCGNAADDDILAEAGVPGCQLFVAATSQDETNMLSCFIAGRMGAAHTVARIRNPEYNDKGLDFLCQNLGLSMAINPDRVSAEELYNLLKFPSAANIEHFSGNFDLIETTLDSSPAIGVSLAELRRRYDAKFLICAVQRNGNLFIPTGNFVLSEGDRVALTAAPGEAQKLLRKLGIFRKSSRNVMILGASRTAFYLSKMLTAAGISVKVIEIDRRRCEEFSAEAVGNGMFVINGDGARQEVLEEEGLTSTDGFVAITGSDEQNILISIYASTRHVPKVIAKVNRPELAALAEKLGLGSVVSPMRIVANQLSRYARALQNTEGSNIETLYRIMDDKAEVLEFSVNGDFRGAGIELKDLGLRQNILIAGIVRGRKAIIPSGSETIQPGDRVIVLSAGHRLGDLNDILSGEESAAQS